MRRAAIYARVSTDEQVEGTSLDTQLGRCRTHAADHGWEVVGEFVDAGVSGARTQRPELDRLRAGVDAGTFDVVLATKTDRLARDLRLLLNLLGDITASGVAVATLDDLIDQGCSALETTHRLNALGRKPPAAARRHAGEGMRWGHRGLAVVLGSQRLLGRVVWFQNSKTGREPIELQFEPVIGQARWEALQAVLASRAAPEKGDRRDYRCNGASGVRNPVRCDDRWRPRADALEQAVWDEVTSALTQPAVLLQMARDFLERVPQATSPGRAHVRTRGRRRAWRAYCLRR